MRCAMARAKYSCPNSRNGSSKTIVSKLPLGGDHPMHPFIIDAKGSIFVDVATATNSCQPQNRQPKIPGANPCTELETRGIWRYDANKTNQTFSPYFAIRTTERTLKPQLSLQHRA